MKLFMRACVAALAVALVWGCTEEMTTGIDSSAVAPTDVTYDENNSTSTTLGFYWEVDEAIAAGAVSFTAQIIKDDEIGGDGYSGRTSQTFQAAARPNDGAIFNGLSENSKYYARVRANYPRSVYSEWVYVTDPQGRRAVIKLGEGVVNENIETITGASSRVVSVSPTTAVVEWSVTDFTDLQVDASCDCSIELYKDAGCSDLWVSWDIEDHSLYSGQPRFIFSGLQPGTKYWFVTEIKVPVNDYESTSYVSEPVEVETEAAKAVAMPDYAGPGDVILYQDFSELIWGGDAVNKAVGYSAEKRSSVSALKNARGFNPVGGDYGFYLCTSGTEMGLYNSIQKALKGSNTSLSQWAELREDSAVAGMICGRPGSVKLGAASRVGSIVTPELSALTETATVEVSFKASPYGNNIETLDPLGTAVRVLDGVNVDANIVTSAQVNSVVHTFDLVNDLSMREYTCIIYNATPTTRIAIGPERAQGETGQHRMVIDDICVKVIEYKETAIEVEKPQVVLAAGEGLLMATWNDCANASSYDVEYRKASESVWGSAGNTTYTSMTLKGLVAETEYQVRVKAKYSDKYTSDWSDVVTIVTPALTSTLTMSAPVVNESQIGFRWYTTPDLSVDINAPYTLELYKGIEFVVRLALGAKGVPESSLMQLTGSVLTGAETRPELWNATTGPCFQFTGLEPSTEYTLKVTNRDLQLTAECKATTAASKVVTVPQSATSGDVILFEDFSELRWGGLPRLSVYGFGMPGVNSEKRNSLDRFYNLSGEQPLANDAYRLWLCAPAKDYGLLNTAWRAVANTRLKDWGAISENYDGGAGTLCGVAGMIKLGAAGYYGQILTPALTCLPGNSTIEVSFDMCAFTGDGIKAQDSRDAVVKVIEGAELGQNGDMRQALVKGKEVQVREFEINANVSNLTRYTFTLENVKPGSRIAIGTTRPVGGKDGNRRAYLDNVQIRIVK